ncbi:MAG: deoxyribose-phosphate aldolase [Desulfovibrionaceae bacterium]
MDADPEQTLASRIDHTLLRPEAGPADIERLCAEAVTHGFRAVCVNPAHVQRAAGCLAGSSVLVACVAGFPLGANLPEVLALEATRAVGLGAEELDMVLPVWALRCGDDAAVLAHLTAACAPGVPVKAILETGLLTDDEKRRACALCVRGGAAFVKTCTGFGPGRATAADVRLLRAAAPGLGVKASGGIADRAAALELLAAGADVLGCSRSVAIVTGAAEGDAHV